MDGSKVNREAIVTAAQGSETKAATVTPNREGFDYVMLPFMVLMTCLFIAVMYPFYALGRLLERAWPSVWRFTHLDR
jgi:hypothetical protein